MHKSFFKDLLLFVGGWVALIGGVAAVALIGVYFENSSSLAGDFYRRNEERAIGMLFVCAFCIGLFAVFHRILNKMPRPKLAAATKPAKPMARTPLRKRIVLFKPDFSPNAPKVALLLFSGYWLVKSVKENGIMALVVILGIALTTILIICIILLALPERKWRAYVGFVNSKQTGKRAPVPYAYMKQFLYSFLLLIFVLLTALVLLFPI